MHVKTNQCLDTLPSTLNVNHRWSNTNCWLHGSCCSLICWMCRCMCWYSLCFKWAALNCGPMHWLFPFCRQVYEAYKSGKVDEAMSVGFILFLLCGDLGNLAGCYLTRQLPIQVGYKGNHIYLLIHLLQRGNSAHLGYISSFHSGNSMCAWV